MPDVDEAVRLLTRACTDKYASFSDVQKKKLVDDFIRLGNERIPREFRNKNKYEIQKYFFEINSRVRKEIIEIFECDKLHLKLDSNNNREGSDLIAILTYGNKVIARRIELKFGQETLKAVGLKSFDSIFVVQDDGSFYKRNLTTIKEKQRQKIINSNNQISEDELIDNLSKLLEPLIQESNHLLQQGKLKVDNLQMKAWLSGTGSVKDANNVETPVKIYPHWSGNIEVKEPLELDGNWKITEISPSIEKKSRINFLVTNNKTEAKFLLTWKNDLTFNNKKWSAKVGINTYCFNVWANKKE